MVAVPLAAVDTHGSVGSTLTLAAARELVYRDSQSADLLSELDWSSGPTATVELETATDWFPGLRTGLALTVGRALTSSTMTDDDWNAGTVARGHSESPSYLTSFLGVRAEAESPLRWGPWGWTPLVGARYLLQDWEAWDGTKLYQNTDGSSQAGGFSGQVMSYRQEWVAPYLGAKVRRDLGDWSFGVGLNAVPILFCFDSDHHTLRNVTFLDFPRGGWGLEPSASIGYRVPQGPLVSLRARGAWYQAARGDSYSVASSAQSGGTATVSANTSGAALSELSFGVFVGD